MSKDKYDLTVNVMMIGGRRCGKTSVLASMQSCFEETVKKTPLYIGPASPEMLDILEEKRQEMTRFFQERSKIPSFTPNHVPTEEIHEHPFYVKIKDKKSRIRINFIDYPGGWLSEKEKRAEHQKELQDYMKTSRILLIVIDTPHLMENHGKYNGLRNRCYRVTEMVKGTHFADQDKGPGMVLFVPLKCERYAHRGEMGAVSASVQKAYKDLLQYLQQPGADGQSSQITTAITPILTLGGAEFAYFKRDSEGEIIINPKWDTPENPIYIFSDDAKDEPEPRYCEQPLLYVLSHTFRYAEKLKADQKIGIKVLDFIVDIVQSNLLHWSSAKDYLAQMKTINKHIKRDGDGYTILHKGILKL